VIARPLAVAALLIAGAPLAAQDEGAGPARRERPREEVFRVVDEFIAGRLQERLGLGEGQAARALPLVRRLHADRRRFAERRIRAVQEMRRMVRSGANDDARAAALLQQLRSAEAEEQAAVRSAQEALDAVLTPTQQVKYRIFEAEVEHRLRQAMARVRAQRREGMGRPRRETPRRDEPPPR
jgi:hypothetical protein